MTHKMNISQIRETLENYLIYLSLVTALDPDEGDKRQELKAFLKELDEFLHTATPKDLRNRGANLVTLLSRAADLHSELLPHRKTPRHIAQDFKELCKETDVRRFGIAYEWLAERFKFPSDWPAPDLPPHARVGIGPHAGHASVEEAFLLEDTYFLLAQAEASLNRLESLGATLRDLKTRQDRGVTYRFLAKLNSEACTFSRLSVVSAATFVEVFVNSVGWAESKRPNLHPDVLAQLQGNHKERYLSLETKLERYPKLIRTDGITPIVLSDPKQAREPFVSFLADVKGMRDSSVHYAPGKLPIWRPPQDWLSLAMKSAETSVRVAGEFWSACYPGKGLPKYLDELCHSRYLDRARERVSQHNPDQQPA